MRPCRCSRPRGAAPVVGRKARKGFQFVEDNRVFPAYGIFAGCVTLLDAFSIKAWSNTLVISVHRAFFLVCELLPEMSNEVEQSIVCCAHPPSPLWMSDMHIH